MMTSTDHRKLEEAIRRGVHAAIREVLAPIMETPDFKKRLAMHIAARCVAAGVRKPEGTAPLLREPMPEPGGWTVGRGDQRRLTEAGLAELKRLAGQRMPAAQIARVLGVTGRAVRQRLKDEPKPSVPQAERDLARAEKTRAYQRERVRKAREAKKEQQPPAEAAPPAAHTVVVPAVEVPAPTPEKPKAEPQVITTTTKDVRAWLVASLKAGGLTQLQAMDRVGFMTHDQALEEANQRRLRAGYPPFAFLGTRSAA